MSGAEGRPERRLRLVRPRRGQAAPDPRVDGLDALLRGVDDLRLTLETDLTLAASAVEAGEPHLAADILSADRDALHRFEEQSLAHLGELEHQDRPHRVRVPAHAGPILVAAALVGLLAGVAPQALAPRTDPATQAVAATDSLQRLQESAESGDAEQVRAASRQLHLQLADVVANAGTDPEAAQTALLLLTYEQSAIVRSGDSVALADVLRQSRALVRAIVAALPPASRPKVRSVTTVVTEPSSAAKPKPTATTSTAKPKATASSRPSPTSSPTPSPSPTKGTGGYPLPSTPSMP